MKNYRTESIVPAILFISAYPTGLYPVLKMKNFQKGATGKIVTSDFIISGCFKSNLKMSVGECLFSKLKSHNNQGDREAETNKIITVRDFLRLSIRIGKKFKGMGLTRENVVCFIGKSDINMYAAVTGAFFVGATVLPLDYNLSSDIFNGIIRQTQPKIVFFDSDTPEGIISNLVELVVPPKMVSLDSSPSFFNFSIDDFNKFTQVDDDDDGDDDDDEFKPVSFYNPEESVAILICSSGTFGNPKTVMLTHTNMTYQITVWCVTSQFNKLLLCPAVGFSFFFWISGILSYLSCLCLNYEMIILRDVQPDAVLRVIQNFKPSWGIFSPSLLKHITTHPNFKNYDVSSMAYIATGGSSLQKEIALSLKEFWGPQIICHQSYGMTELSGTITYCQPDDDILSVGRLFPGVQMKVVSVNDKTLLGANQEGVIYLKSPSVMKGYLGNEKATEEVFIDGWYCTGDVGYYDINKVIYVTGRLKEFIKYRNRMINPIKLENKILTLPQIDDVGLVKIKGNDDDDDDQDGSIMALVVLRKNDVRLNEKEIHKLIEEKLPDYLKLRQGVRFIDKIPRTSSGKMLRKELLKIANTFLVTK
ncbi:luciferase, putative [Pediculus humanus corporis]|uniref:Luciferase, putative n=1 Tax=Pediculus humanus subsp. corporis TaxID=121224 RepID=E0VZP8_PEDHC|nr:luciferase, putative [Pediculus humanus corporis]EEB18854.1 luciferase, putative [Pediculus humanus corporis]